MAPAAPVLVIAWGNPSRGDDALGPMVFDRLEREKLPDVEVITDFQLQIEHSTDIAGRSLVIFVDASMNAPVPFELYRINPEKDDSFTSHALSPQSLLSICKQVNGPELPISFLLAIRGYDFELGHEISAAAEKNMELAYTELLELIRISNKNPIKYISNY